MIIKYDLDTIVYTLRDSAVVFGPIVSVIVNRGSVEYKVEYNGGYVWRFEAEIAPTLSELMEIWEVKIKKENNNS